MDEIRTLSHSLSGDYQKHFGLVESMEKMQQRISRGGMIKMNVDIEMGRQELDKDKELILLRVLQELINNTLKHSEANKINLKITIPENLLNLDYEDNGKGISENSVKGLGSVSIENRLKILKADWHIDSKPGEGYALRATIPINEL